MKSKSGRSKTNLKSAGARYATTNSKGERNYYASSRDAEAGGAPIRREDARTGKQIVANPIAITDMNPTAPIPLPPKPIPSPVPDITEGNASLAGGMSQFGFAYDPKTQQFATAPQDPNAGFANNLTQLLNSVGAPPSEADQYQDTYGISERQAGRDFRDAQKQVNSLTSELNAITSSAQQQQLNLQNQGRGITTDILDTQAYEISRRAAVAALPVQAQLQAAQGNLEMAQKHVDTLFKLKSQDAANQYQYKSQVAQSIFTFMNQAEQRRLDMVMREEDRSYQREQSNLAQMNEWARLAVQTGQSNLISSFGALDPKSPTFSSDFAKLQSRVQMPQDTPSTPTQLVDLGNRKALINTQTGEIIQDYGGEVDDKQIQRTQTRVANAENVIKKVVEAKSRLGVLTTGFGGGVLKNVPGSSAYNLDKTITTIKANLGFDALQQMREASPTGGALGQVAVQELEMLQSTVANLSVGLDRSTLQQNLTDVETHYSNWLRTLGYEVVDGNVIYIRD